MKRRFADAPEEVCVIHLGAYFRNALPPGEFPYPFWHSADKWAAYEAANELKFYLKAAARRSAGLTPM